MRRVLYCRLALLLLTVLAVTLPVRADEGQWPPDRLGDLDWSDLQKRGLKLTPEEIWNSEGTGLAMAVARISGCTAAFISEDGLLVTLPLTPPSDFAHGLRIQGLKLSGE